MLTFDQVSYQYPSEDFDIIHRLSFRVEPGSFVSLIGVSGCGKSTIFRLTNGLLTPKSGRILVGEKSVSEQKKLLRLYASKGSAFSLAQHRENLRLPLEIRGGCSRKEQAARVEVALAQVGLAGCGEKFPASCPAVCASGLLLPVLL